MSSEALSVPEGQGGLAYRHELSVEDLVAQVQKIQAVMAKVMKEGEHYGVIPGTGTKPTLLKAGAEKLCLLFRFDPQYQSTELYEGGHLTVKSICTLWHIPTGLRIGSGEGSCSTKEAKYAYRKGVRKCPACRQETIIKGKEEYGGGWLCFAKKGGCGAKFPDGDPAIEGQEVPDRVSNDDLPDQYNTVLKMANKRSLVAATLNATAASDIFTQDLEEMQPDVLHSDEPAPAAPVKRADGATRVVKVEDKTGTNKKTGKPWIRHVVAFEDGRVASTFDGALGAEAKRLQASKALTIPTLVKSGDYLNLEGFSAPPAEGASTPDTGETGEVIDERQHTTFWGVAKAHGWPPDEVQGLLAQHGYVSSKLIRVSDYEGLLQNLKNRAGKGNGGGA